MKILHKSNSFLIFNQYHDYSIKGVTHQDRDGNAHCSHNLSLSTPLPSKEVTLHLPETKKQIIKLLPEGLLKQVFSGEACNRMHVRLHMCKSV